MLFNQLPLVDIPFKLYFLAYIRKCYTQRARLKSGCFVVKCVFVFLGELSIFRTTILFYHGDYFPKMLLQAFCAGIYTGGLCPGTTYNHVRGSRCMLNAPCASRASHCPHERGKPDRAPGQRLGRSRGLPPSFDGALSRPRGSSSRRLGRRRPNGCGLAWEQSRFLAVIPFLILIHLLRASILILRASTL